MPIRIPKADRTRTSLSKRPLVQEDLEALIDNGVREKLTNLERYNAPYSLRERPTFRLSLIAVITVTIEVLVARATDQSAPKPPKFGLFLLGLVCPPSLFEAVVGDIEELFAGAANKRGWFAAQRIFWWQISTAAFRFCFRAFLRKSGIEGLVRRLTR